MKKIEYCGQCKDYKATKYREKGIGVISSDTVGDCHSKKTRKARTGSRTKACKHFRKWWQIWK